MVGFRMAGIMLSGSAIGVFVLGNMGLGWGVVVGEKYWPHISNTTKLCLDTRYVFVLCHIVCGK